MDELFSPEGIAAAAAILIAVVAVFSIIIHTFINGISPMPSSWKARRAIAAILAEEMKTGSIAELGSGWGTMLPVLSRKLPQCAISGFENSPVPFLFSRLLLLCIRRKQIRVIFGSFYKTPLAPYDAVVCYLYPGAMEKLKLKFTQELKSGSLIISNTFAVPGWEPERTVVLNDFFRSPVYVYRMGPGNSGNTLFIG